MFIDREDAGKQLAQALKKYKNNKQAIVLAIPRGGVVPGFIIAEELHLPLEVVMVKKIGHPSNPEYAIGAVSLKGAIVNGHEGVSKSYIDQETKNIQNLLMERYRKYHGDKPPVNIKNKTVIIVDDGVATGKTLMGTLELLGEEEPDQIIVALPVGPVDSVENLKHYADEVICLEEHHDFHAISMYYRNFSQVSDDEVVELLGKSSYSKSSGRKV